MKDDLDLLELKKLIDPDTSGGSAAETDGISVEEILAEYASVSLSAPKNTPQTPKKADIAPEKAPKAPQKAPKAPSAPAKASVPQKAPEKPAVKAPAEPMPFDTSVFDSIAEIPEYSNVTSSGGGAKDMGRTGRKILGRLHSLGDTATRDFDTTKTVAPKKAKKVKKSSLPPVLGEAPEQGPEAGAKFATARMRSIAMREAACALTAAAAIWLSISPIYSLPMPFGLEYTSSPFIYLFLFVFCQTASMFLAIDIICAGLARLVRGQGTADSLLAVSSIACLIHLLTVFIAPEWGGYLPYCAVSCVSLFAGLAAKRRSYSALRRQMKAAAISDHPMGVMIEETEDGMFRAMKEPVTVDEELLASMREPTQTDRFSRFYAPFALFTSLVMAVIASFGAGAPERFPIAFSALTLTAAPLGLPLSSASPFARAARRLFASGAALTGTSQLGRAKKLDYAVLRDTDVFPPGSVGINGIKVIGNQSFDTVLAYTAAAVNEAKIGFVKVFSDLLEQQFIKRAVIERVRYYESGGISAEIDGNAVLVGTAGFLTRMGVHVTEGLELKSAVFTSINSRLAGIFSLKYVSQASAADAFYILRRAKIIPTLAVRDFNMTPGMVETRLRLKSGSVDYPDIAQRLDLSEDGRFFEEPAAAIMSRDGASPFAETLAAAKRMNRSVAANIVLSALSAALGTLIMTYLLFNGAFAAALPHILLAYQLLWLVPAFLSTNRV